MGTKHEPVAIQQCINYQRACGNNHLMVSPSGFLVSESHPYLGASPDGAVYDPLDVHQPFGFLEVKPYTQHNVTPADACSSTGFFCALERKSDGTQQLRLRQHLAQVQGHMAIEGGRGVILLYKQLKELVQRGYSSTALLGIYTAS